MGQTEYEKVNNEKIIGIDLQIDKACFFPGEIITGKATLFPRVESIFQIVEDPQLNIILYQKSHYVYSTGSKKNRSTVTRNEESKLSEITLNFKNYIKEDFLDYSSGFSIPFSIQVPLNAYPTIITYHSANVSHYIILELPQVEGKRAKRIVIKNVLPNNPEGTLLAQNVEINQVYDKKKFLVNKGAFLLSVKLPRNYFYYHEKVPLEINIDCSKLKDLTINSVNIRFTIFTRKNFSNDHLKADRTSEDCISNKNINLEKGLSEYKISDFVEFPIDFKYYTPNAYNEIEKIGPIEVNYSFGQQLFQSSYNGLVSVDYIIRISLIFGSSLTFDEYLDIPIYFVIKTENN